MSSMHGLKGNAFMSRHLTAFMTKYGAAGKALMARCLDNWVQPQESRVEKEPVNFEDSVARRVVTVGTRYVFLAMAESASLTSLFQGDMGDP